MVRKLGRKLFRAMYEHCNAKKMLVCACVYVRVKSQSQCGFNTGFGIHIQQLGIA